MRFTFLPFSTLVVILGLAGCATQPTAVAPKKNPPAATTETSHPPVQPASPSTKENKDGLPPGEYAILVESVPDGATVVVNGIPVGKAPQRILLPGTQRGFFRDQVSLKVRFIAVDAAHPSQTVEELLTPLDRIPAGVRFTPAGASRLAR